MTVYRNNALKPQTGHALRVRPEGLVARARHWLDRVRTPVAAHTIEREMDSLAATVLHLADEQGSLVLHVTSSRAGEGTSTIARGLAASAAHSRGCSVALVDAGSLARNAGGTGLVQAQEAGRPLPLSRKIVAGAEMSVGVLGSGESSVPSAEQLRQLYAKLRGEYRLTVIDCPPLDASPDTAILSRVADGTILVVAAEQTRIADIERSRALLGKFGATLLGVVMNGRQARIPGFLDSAI